MSEVYVYVNGGFSPLKTQKVASNGQMITMNANDAIYFGGRKYELWPNVSNNLDISNGQNRTFENEDILAITISSGGTMIMGSGTSSYVTRNRTGAIYNKGHLYVSSGAIASDINTRETGHLFVYDGAIVSNVIVDGMMDVFGGVANNISIGQAGYSRCHADVVGATMNSAYVYGGILQIHSNGIVSKAVIYNSGEIELVRPSTAKDIVISSGGSLTMMNSCLASMVEVSSGGLLEIGMSGCASSITVHSGGSLMVYGSAYNVVSRAGAYITVNEQYGYITYAQN